jgi:hypothetical protein
MARIIAIYVIHRTSLAADAGTDADFQLHITRSSPARDVLLPFPEKVGVDERVRGQTDIYYFDVANANIDSTEPGFSIIMRMTNTNDGWLPSSIFVIGVSPTRVRGGIKDVLLGSHPEWPRTKWFDRGRDAVGPAEHVISGQG